MTGGAGFIGSNLIRKMLGEADFQITNVDKLSYASQLASLEMFESTDRYEFIHRDLCDFADLSDLLIEQRIDVVFHLAAETHVDRSIDAPAEFTRSNVLGTQRLLEAIQRYLDRVESMRSKFRLIHVSTDEVFGSLGPDDDPFDEGSNYRPNSPYSASKAAADHLVRAWSQTFQIPAMITHCTNNFGPYQFPEKLIPVVISRCLLHQEIPVYGNGSNIRDWIHVEDHCAALLQLAERGKCGESYVIGAENEWTNLDLVKRICLLLDELSPRADQQSYTQQISFVEDRPGHDFRYAVDPAKITAATGWRCQHEFDQGLKSTVQWYVEHPSWMDPSQTTRLRTHASER